MISVLYVDDEIDLLEVGKLFLEQSPDFHVTTIESAAEALSLLDESLFDVILSDFQMPEMDGITFLKEVRRSGSRIPVIFFTGKGREEVVIEALNAGATSYVQKGGDPKSQFAELEHRIRTAVERQRAGEALQESEEKDRLLIEQAEEGVWIVDKEYRTTFINNRLARMFGYPPQEMLGKFVRDFLPASDQEKHDQRIRERWEGKSDRFEQQFVRKDGSVFWAIASVTPMRENSRVVGAFSMLTDITEKKRAEEALIEVNRKTSLLSSITRHDINNQLTVLLGYLAILRDQIHDPALAGYFSRIENAGERISAMIRFTKTYENIGVHAPEWQEIRTIVENVARDAPLGQVRVVNDIPAGTDIFVDPLIVKVFYNLMENAVRYGETITTIRFSISERERNLIILCEDNGVGIPKEAKNEIFNLGYGKNTGLGLFLTREVLSITGITISETGDPGTGARFEMIVPAGIFRKKMDAFGPDSG